MIGALSTQVGTVAVDSTSKVCEILSAPVVQVLALVGVIIDALKYDQ